MNTVQLKSDLFQKIDALPPKKVKEIYALFQNYLNSKDDVDDWADLTLARIAGKDLDRD